MRTLPASARFVKPAVGVSSSSSVRPQLVLFDVMDTLVADPFFRGFEKDLFGLSSIKELFAVKDPESFMVRS